MKTAALTQKSVKVRVFSGRKKTIRGFSGVPSGFILGKKLHLIGIDYRYSSAVKRALRIEKSIELPVCAGTSVDDCKVFKGRPPSRTLNKGREKTIWGLVGFQVDSF